MSLPDLLAGEALEQLGGAGSGRAHGLIVEYLVSELLHTDPRRAADYVEALLDHGISVERLVNGYVPAAADYLGEAWCEDRMDFSQVTHASGILMQIVRDYAAQPSAVTIGRGERPPRVLLARPRGEEHVLGLMLVARAMRADGWLVRVELSDDGTALSSALATQTYDFVGLTAASEEREVEVTAAIGLCRRMQPEAKVAVGGYWADMEPRIAQQLGADATIGRGIDPVDAAAELMGLEPLAPIGNNNAEIAKESGRRQDIR